MVPVIVNQLTPNNTRQEWALAFYAMGAIMVVCNIFYCFFASAQLQPWATAQVRLLLPSPMAFLLHSLFSTSASEWRKGPMERDKSTQ
jgi:hypothetical protein